MPYVVKFPPNNFERQGRDAATDTAGPGPSEPKPMCGPIECPPLPAGVKLVRYTPKIPPVAVAPVSIVTDVAKFMSAYLEELDARLHHPVQIKAGAGVFEILAKLAEVGLELEIASPHSD